MAIYYKNKLIKKQSKNEGKAVLSFMTIIGIVIMLVIYLIQINGIITENYKIREFKSELKKIQEINQQLQIQAAQVRSLPNLEKAIKNLNMVSVEKINYLTDIKGEMAVVW